MTGAQRDELEKRIQTGYYLHSSHCLIDGLRIYRKYPLGFIGWAMLLPLLSGVLSLLSIGNPAVLLITSVLFTPLVSAGFYVVADRIVRQLPVHFSDFWRVGSYAVPLVLCQVIYLLIVAVVITPSYLSLEQVGFFEWYREAITVSTQPPAAPPLGDTTSTIVLLNLLPLVYLLVGYCWTYPLILFWGAGPWPALEYSRRLVSRRWWNLFWLGLNFFSLSLVVSMLISTLVAISITAANVGTLLIFLLLPWYHCALYAGFRRAVDPVVPVQET